MLLKGLSTTKKNILKLSGISVLAASIWGVLFFNGIVSIHHPTREQFPIQGIDISQHQGSIDWSKIDRQKVNFVFIKATEGGDFRDSSFRQNWDSAKNAKITRGAYHFFTFCKSGALQAQNFIETVPIDRDTLPPVIDLEFSGNCQRKPSLAELKQELTVYINRVSSVYHQQPILYVTNEFYTAYLQTEFTEYPIWISDFYTVPKVGTIDRPWLFWQHSERGRIEGFNTLVDLNVFSGNLTQFQQILIKNPRLLIGGDS